MKVTLQRNALADAPSSYGQNVLLQTDRVTINEASTQEMRIYAVVAVVKRYETGIQTSALVHMG